ncbi:MAG: KilA-N domain-containing protein [[Eubacterium] sulci]|nr:KilA-N domain-containing protein [[Eubacterium] sulci]MBF1181395.1 KilA-N domain-containing protein [[Eubacterium] sulci]
MSKEFQEKMNINGLEITVVSQGDEDDYISLTDIAKHKNPEDPRIVVSNWLSSYATIDFLATWEQLYNPNFNRMEFQTVRSEPGRLVMTPSQWINRMQAIGIRSKAGRYGGTYAHKDIAFEFASWISPEFKLYIIKDYQRLKEDENNRLSLNWNMRRLLTKTNYKIHTDAIQENLIPEDLTKQQQGYVYANEADVLNVALFGMTAKEWRKLNPDRPKSENIRDSATLEQLIVLTNLESYNAELIKDGIPQPDRLVKLNAAAKSQMTSLLENPSLKKLK